MQEAARTVALRRPLDITPGESFVSVWSRFSSDDSIESAGSKTYREARKRLDINHLRGAQKCVPFRAPSEPHFESAPDRLKCKQGAKRTVEGTGPSHSKRRISTGNSFAAARAGTIVARSDIPIATNEIHTPSVALGWKGT